MDSTTVKLALVQNKLISTVAKVTPAQMLAEQHQKKAEPRSAQK